MADDVVSGPTGYARGAQGWSPVFALVPIGNGIGLQLIDWTGSSGTKPPVGLYVGAQGLTSDPTQAVDIGGPASEADASATSAAASAQAAGQDAQATAADRVAVHADRVQSDANLAAWSALTIGSVTTLPAGSQATATIGGTPGNPVLNLGLPAGTTAIGLSTAADVVAATDGSKAVSPLAMAAVTVAALAYGQNFDQSAQLALAGKLVLIGFGDPTNLSAWITADGLHHALHSFGAAANGLNVTPAGDLQFGTVAGQLPLGSGGDLIDTTSPLALAGMQVLKGYADAGGYLSYGVTADGKFRANLAFGAGANGLSVDQMGALNFGAPGQPPIGTGGDYFDTVPLYAVAGQQVTHGWGGAAGNLAAFATADGKFGANYAFGLAANGLNTDTFGRLQLGTSAGVLPIGTAGDVLDASGLWAAGGVQIVGGQNDAKDQAGAWLDILGRLHANSAIGVSNGLSAAGGLLNLGSAEGLLPLGTNGDTLDNRSLVAVAGESVPFAYVDQADHASHWVSPTKGLQAPNLGAGGGSLSASVQYETPGFSAPQVATLETVKGRLDSASPLEGKWNLRDFWSQFYGYVSSPNAFRIGVAWWGDSIADEVSWNTIASWQRQMGVASHSINTVNFGQGSISYATTGTVQDNGPLPVNQQNSAGAPGQYCDFTYIPSADHIVLSSGATVTFSGGQLQNFSELRAYLATGPSMGSALVELVNVVSGATLASQTIDCSKDRVTGSTATGLGATKAAFTNLAQTSGLAIRITATGTVVALPPHFLRANGVVQVKMSRPGSTLANNLYASKAIVDYLLTDLGISLMFNECKEEDPMNSIPALHAYWNSLTSKFSRIVVGSLPDSKDTTLYAYPAAGQPFVNPSSYVYLNDYDINAIHRRYALANGCAYFDAAKCINRSYAELVRLGWITDGTHPMAIANAFIALILVGELDVLNFSGGQDGRTPIGVPLPKKTIAGLPGWVDDGVMFLATDARKSGEAAGHGSGVPVMWSGGQTGSWLTLQLGPAPAG